MDSGRVATKSKGEIRHYGTAVVFEETRSFLEIRALEESRPSI